MEIYLCIHQTQFSIPMSRILQNDQDYLAGKYLMPETTLFTPVKLLYSKFKVEMFLPENPWRSKQYQQVAEDMVRSLSRLVCSQIQ